MQGRTGQIDLIVFLSVVPEREYYFRSNSPHFYRYILDFSLPDLFLLASLMGALTEFCLRIPINLFRSFSTTSIIFIPYRYFLLSAFSQTISANTSKVS